MEVRKRRFRVRDLFVLPEKTGIPDSKNSLQSKDCILQREKGKDENLLCQDTELQKIWLREAVWEIFKSCGM